MRSIIFIVVLSASLACVNKVIKTDNDKVQLKLSNADSAEILRCCKDDFCSEIIPVSYKACKGTFGEPMSSDLFTIPGENNPFRQSIYFKYSIDEQTNDTIKIQEVTWALDSDYRLTIWYEHLSDSVMIAKDGVYYFKNVCF